MKHMMRGWAVQNRRTGELVEFPFEDGPLEIFKSRRVARKVRWLQDPPTDYRVKEVDIYIR